MASFPETSHTCVELAIPPPVVLTLARLQIWGFGVLLYEMCSGHMLFTQDMSNNDIVLTADKCRLCLWHTISDRELEPVFAELTGGLNRGPEWLQAPTTPPALGITE